MSCRAEAKHGRTCRAEAKRRRTCRTVALAQADFSRRSAAQADWRLSQMQASFSTFVAETTIREANIKAWGNHIVAGLGSLTHSSVSISLAPRVLWLACRVLAPNPALTMAVWKVPGSRRLRRQCGHKSPKPGNQFKTLRPVKTLRSKHGYWATNYDASVVKSPKTLRRQFGRSYDQKKVRNSSI